MGKAAKILANYVIQKGTVKEDEREIYEYGFTVAMAYCFLWFSFLCVHIQEDYI